MSAEGMANTCTAIVGSLSPPGARSAGLLLSSRKSCHLKATEAGKFADKFSFLSGKGLRAVNKNPCRVRRSVSPCVCIDEGHKDTRIHYGSSDEGWVGGSSEMKFDVEADARILEPVNTSSILSLLMQATDSHYQCLGLAPNASDEDVRAAYRRLSKLYHPDTTDLPLELASARFIRLKEAHTVLSSADSRRFYDWKLAQEVSKQGSSSWPATMGRRQQSNGRTSPSGPGRGADPESDGSNIPFTDQIFAALAFDVFALGVSILVVIYVLFFKAKH